MTVNGLRDFEKRLGRLITVLRNDRTLNETALDIAERNIIADVNRGVSPDGTPFAPLSPEYAKRKRAQFGDKPILKRTGHMLSGAGIRRQINRQSTALFFTAPYAGYHQDGTPKMPARPFAGISDQTERDIEQASAERLEEIIDETL